MGYNTTNWEQLALHAINHRFIIAHLHPAHNATRPSVCNEINQNIPDPILGLVRNNCTLSASRKNNHSIIVCCKNLRKRESWEMEKKDQSDHFIGFTFTDSVWVFGLKGVNWKENLEDDIISIICEVARQIKALSWRGHTSGYGAWVKDEHGESLHGGVRSMMRTRDNQRSIHAWCQYTLSQTGHREL